MSHFARHRRSGRVIADFSGLEAALLRSLASQVVELLHSERAVVAKEQDPWEALMDLSGPVAEPDDPVLARLFPSAYPEDPEATAEFRRFTEPALREGKVASARTVIDTLEEAGLSSAPEEGTRIDVELTPETAQAWLRALTDIRLALATRLGVEEGDEDRWLSLPDDDPLSQAHDIYEWVGYLQETLVHAVFR